MPDYAYLVKFLASLTIVIVALYTVYYALSRYGLTAKGSKGNIELLEVRPLSRGKSLFLVKVKNSVILLAVDDKSIKKIKEWEDEEAPPPNA